MVVLDSLHCANDREIRNATCGVHMVSVFAVSPHIMAVTYSVFVLIFT